MNGHTARRLRQEIYGDNSHKAREYGEGKRFLPGTKHVWNTGARVNLGLRGEYLTAKDRSTACQTQNEPTPPTIRKKRKPDGGGRWKRRARGRSNVAQRCV